MPAYSAGVLRLLRPGRLDPSPARSPPRSRRHSCSDIYDVSFQGCRRTSKDSSASTGSLASTAASSTSESECPRLRRPSRVGWRQSFVGASNLQNIRRGKVMDLVDVEGLETMRPSADAMQQSTPKGHYSKNLLLPRTPCTSSVPRTPLSRAPSTPARTSKKSPSSRKKSPLCSRTPVEAVLGDLEVARRHRLGFFEVKKINEEFESTTRNLAGGIDQDTFAQVMCRIFEVANVDKKVLEDAYESTGMARDVDIDKFLSWYVQNMFSQITALTASPLQAASDSLVYDLAREYGVSAVKIDKIKQQFDHFDLNRSGFIEYDEFVGMLQTMLKTTCPSDLSEDRIHRFWKEIDADGSSSVSFSEFTQWYLKYFTDAGDSGTAYGLVEAFYDSFNPVIQRQHSVNKTPTPSRRRHTVY